MTLALVVASFILLILGFVQDALGFIYLSMLCAGVAAVALFVFARLARRRAGAQAGAEIAASSPAPEAEEPPLVATGARPLSRRAPAENQPAATATAAADFSPAGSGSLTQIRDEPAEEDDAFEWAPEEDEPTREMAPAAVGTAAEEPGRPTAAVGRGPGGADEDDDWGEDFAFPIENYDELRVGQILPLLGELGTEELQDVRDRELADKARRTVLARIDDRLAELRDASLTDRGVPAPALARSQAEDDAEQSEPDGAPVKKAPARSASKTTSAKKAATKTPARKTAAKKTTATKAAPAKRATSTAKATPAKATPAKATSTKATPAKAPASKSESAKAPAKKAAARSSTTTTKAGTARTASKDTPAKKAAAARKTAKRSG